MADKVNDFNFAFSGNVTYADGSKSVIECYYDSKAGAYSPVGAGRRDTDAQLANSLTNPQDYIVAGAATNWFTQLQWFFQSTVIPYLSRVPVRIGADPAVPVPLKDITDMVLHLRGTVAFEDGTWDTISGTFDKWQGGSVRFAPGTHWATFVWQTDNAYTALIEQALNYAMFNVELT